MFFCDGYGGVFITGKLGLPLLIENLDHRPTMAILILSCCFAAGFVSGPNGRIRPQVPEQL
jgi:hypothetical protein